MKVYFYNPDTYEYVAIAEADLDPVATFRAKKEVYLKPAFSTFIEPPKVTKPQKVAVFNEAKNEWEIVPDYRGCIVYNIETRQPRIWEQIGAIPVGYTLELKPNVVELQTQYLEEIAENFYNCINKIKIDIPKTGLTFTYKSIEGLLKEKELGLVASRDDNDKVYAGLTSEQYDDIIKYLKVYGQLAYMAKWTLENSIMNCKDVDILKTFKDKLDIKVNLKQLKQLVKLSDEERNEYFISNAQNIK